MEIFKRTHPAGSEKTCVTEEQKNLDEDEEEEEEEEDANEE